MNAPPAMIERLARLLCRFNSEHEDRWERNVPKAREILAAVRLPSPEMTAAGYQILTSRDATTRQGHPETVWTAMVDAALRHANG